MTKFTYIAIDSTLQSVNGLIEQEDRANVIAALTKQGLRPISIRQASSAKMTFSLDKIFKTNKVKKDHLVMMTRQLSAMISAGVPLVRALTSLSGHSESPALKGILETIIKDVEGGSQLGDALSKHSETFNDVYVNMVRAGEAAGILDDILKRLASQQEKSATIRKKIKSAMAYPSVLMIITVLAFFGLMLFVVPQIGKILTDMGGADASLPGITLFMLGVSNFLITSWFILIPVILGIVYVIVRYIKTPDGKRLYHSVLLKIPGVQNVIRKIAIARFARTFSALMGAGVAVLECLRVTAKSVGNVIYEEALNKAATEVKAGKPLSVVIGQNPLFPPIVAQMLSVGEETGQTDTVLVKVADFYEEEVDVAIEGISSIIEPVMIVLMGAMVGLIAASVMLPISSLAQNIE